MSAESGSGNSGDALTMLRDAGAVLEGHFQYTSGRHGGRYIEKFRLLERPDTTARLCGEIAAACRDLGAELVVGPTTGGILLAHETAKSLGLRAFFAETEAERGGRYFGRGFRFEPGQPTLIVDDVLTTGGSIRDTIAAVEAAGGRPVGVGVVVDRTNGATQFGDLPCFACLALDVASYAAAECPLCAAGAPLTIT